MDKVILPDYWDAEDKANYYDLITRGQALLGKQVPHKDEFLLDMSARMTINQLKGYRDEKSEEEVRQQMESHKEALKHTHILTPDGMYEEGQHPLELNPIYKNVPLSDLPQ